LKVGPNVDQAPLEMIYTKRETTKKGGGGGVKGRRKELRHAKKGKEVPRRGGVLGELT